MCSNSVAPMPSISSMPVASFHSARVEAGSASPAETHLCSGVRRSAAPCAASARYEVGAVNSTVAPKLWMASSSCVGPAFSSSTVEAPTLIGNNSRPPRPKVNPSGGLPMNTSSAEGLSTCGGQQAQIAITSRWKCIVAFGTPVVPEVKPSRQVSSAAVSMVSKCALWRAIATSRLPAPSALLKCPMWRSRGAASAASRSSSASAASHSACVTCAISRMGFSSFARSSGIVATAMAPAFITANQQAASMALFGARNSTRLPGTRPISRTSTLAMRLALSCSSA